MLELNIRYTLTPPTGTISTEGMHLVNLFISRQDAKTESWSTLNPDYASSFLPRLPDDWQWVWLTKQGKLTTRVRKFYYQQGIKCPDSFLTELGNIARAHTEDGTVYHFDFVNRFHWRAGDFGDSGSCYWGSNMEAREILADNGGLAMRFYDENDRGMGRAWIFPMDHTHVVFNGYGFKGHSTLIIARVLAFHLNCTYKQIKLSNQGTRNGTIWINEGIGYAVGPESALVNLRSADLDLPTFEDHCYNCGDALSEYDIYWGADDMAYCESCYYQIFDSCSHCGETHYQQDIRYVDGEYYCPYCFDRYCTECAECGEPIVKRSAKQRKGRYYCREHE